MDLAARHPRLTKATRIIGIVASSLCVATLSLVTYVIWADIALLDARAVSLSTAIQITLFLLFCVWLCFRSIFSKATPHSRNTVRRAIDSMIVIGLLGLVLTAVAFFLNFGDFVHKLLVLSGSMGLLSRGLTLRKANA